MNIGYVLLGLAVGFALLFVSVAVAQTWLHVRLKRRHNEIWHSLGQPMPIVNLGLHNHHLTLRFLRLRQYEALPDDTTRKIAATLRILNRMLLIYIFVGAAAVLGMIKFVK